MLRTCHFLERFREKCTAVFQKEARQNNKLERFPEKYAAGFQKKAQRNKRLTSIQDSFKSGTTLALAALAWLLQFTPAVAIPSPELIVGSLSSLSQLGALLAAMIGGGALFAGTKGAKSAASARRAWSVVALLGLVAGTLLGALVWHISDRSAERQARLEANLLRPARQPGQPIADPTLKELSFRDQQKHPLAMTTVEAAGILASAQHLLVDVREDAEIEMGSLPGVKQVRYPDFDAADPAYQGKTLVFFCHNGNRSHETCEALKAKGIDCRFIVGGLEKWVVEQRPMTGLQNRSLADLRAIPAYPNRDRLLDTPEVKRLIERDKAQVIDVRYPGEFAAMRMPGATNIPIRRISRGELDMRLKLLPKTPVVLPCYDRRSCFFAEVMGLELSRAGHTVAGRYTEPHAYFIPSPRPPHVEAWIAESNKSLWQKAREGLTTLLLRVAEQTGLPVALLLLAVLSRLLIWPFALKSERDQIVAHETAHEVNALKTKLRDDPVRLRRALSNYAVRHNLTPIRNLAALFFLPALALSVLAVGDAAGAKPTPWAWIASLAAPDPTIALPLLFALILVLYGVASFARTTRQAFAIAAIGLPTLAVLTVNLPAAAALYLTISSLLLVAQRAWVVRIPSRTREALRQGIRRWRERRLGNVIILDRAITSSNIGNKAMRLAQLSGAGFPVPAAIALDHVAVSNFLSQPLRTQARAARRIARRVGGASFAVRSSATNEDGAGGSFAGVFDSMLHVKPADLPAAIQRVAASFASARAAAYVSNGGLGNIVIQRMVEPQVSGVVFTRAPDAPGQMLVEMIKGTADRLASGQETPTSYRFGRLTLTPVGQTPEIDLRPLLRFGQQIADLFGKPQDIEWAYAEGQFHILQARDVVAELTEKPLIYEMEALLSVARRGPTVEGMTLLHTSAMMELLPRPTTASLSLLNALWQPGGSVDLACRRLGLAYPSQEDDPPLYRRVNGRLMTDTRGEAQRALRMTPRQRRKLAEIAPDFASDMRRSVLPSLHEAARLAMAIDLKRFSFGDLHRHWQRERYRFLHETHPHAEAVNIVVALVASGGNDQTMTQRPAWQAALLDAAALTQRDRSGAMQLSAGHRSNLDYELAHPRWSEVPGAVEAFAATLKPIKAETPVSGSAADLIALKEDAKHEVLRSVAHLRAILLEIDHRLSLGGHIFELTIDEISSINQDQAQALQVVCRERFHASQRVLQEPPPPARMTARDIETLGSPSPSQAPSVREKSRDGRCKGRGIRVSGRTEVAGRVFVATIEQAENGLPLEGFRDGDILVTPMVHPDWLGHVLRCGGVIADTGGWLSHMAIVAREHSIAMIIGVPNAGQFRNGDRIRMMPDGKVIAEIEAVARLTLVAAPA